MKHRIVAIARAHLRAACVIAMLIQVVELVSVLSGAVRPASLETWRYRAGAAVIIVLSVCLLRVVSYLVYRDIVRVGATAAGQAPAINHEVSTASQFLARIHLHFHGRVQR